MSPMNRRKFIQTLGAASVVPALPALPATTPVAVPNAARFWAIYMTNLHGDVTPRMLTQMTGLAPATTKAIRAKLIADKVISPIGFMRKGIASTMVAKPVHKSHSATRKVFDCITLDENEPHDPSSVEADVALPDNIETPDPQA